MSRTTPAFVLRRRTAYAAAGLLWSGCITYGCWVGIAYDVTPAATVPAAGRWPATSTLHRDLRLPTLIMFVHPRCPCTGASLTELEQLASRFAGRVAVRVVVTKPHGAPAGWERTSHLEHAGRIQQAVVSRDDDGIEAGLFGATTSGESFLYGADGRLRFRGGITWARGHEGTSAGRAALAAMIGAGRTEPAENAVYGCPLRNRPLCPDPSTPGSR